VDRTSTFAIVGLLVVGVGFFLVLLFTNREKSSGTDVPPEAPLNADWTTAPATDGTTTANNVTVTPKTVVTAKHAYRNGMHIVAGEIPLPTPCHLLEAKGTASDDKKAVAIAIVSSIKTDEMCAQVITPARFKVSVKALQSAKLSATLNGQAVTLNLIEAGADDDLDNFELYIKG